MENKKKPEFKWNKENPPKDGTLILGLFNEEFLVVSYTPIWGTDNYAWVYDQELLSYMERDPEYWTEIPLPWDE